MWSIIMFCHFIQFVAAWTILYFRGQEFPVDDDGTVNWVFQWLWQTVSEEQFHWFLDNLGSSSVAELPLLKPHTSRTALFYDFFVSSEGLWDILVFLIFDLKALKPGFYSVFIWSFGNRWPCSWHDFTQNIDGSRISQTWNGCANLLFG